jgi:ATP-dependent Clp protease ATP-binding subunit ClpB
MIRLDMTEFMEKQSVSRLIGAPPGYVGYEEGGKLTEAVRRRPYSLVLLDEVEKAHPDVLGLLLQIMEEGELTDSAGRKVSFRNTVVVMTCNVGGQLKGEGLGFCARGRDAELKDALRQYFTPEFLGRLDAKVAFRPLTPCALEAVAEKYLEELRRRASAQGIRIRLQEGLGARLCTLCAGEDGARYLRRLVQTRVEGPLAEALLRSERRPAVLEGVWEKDAVRFK